MSAAQITAPRSLKTLTRSRWRDAPGGRIGRAEPQQPEVVAGDQGAMVVHLIDRAVLAVAAGVEAVAAVRGDHLQRIAVDQFGGAQPFPGQGCSG